MKEEIEKLSPKDQFLAQFQENFKEHFLPDTMDEEQKSEVLKHTTKSKIKSSMFMSIPMFCKGPSCSFADSCPLQQQGIAPIGKSCSLELGMIANFMADYIEELNIDPNNLIELSQVRDLVDLEVQYIRKSKLLAKEDFIQEFVVGIDANGDPVMSTRLHLAITYEDGILKKKAIIWKQLIATREARAKVGLAVLDSATSMSALVENMREIQFKRDAALRQKLGLEDVDDYIDSDFVDDEDDK